MPLAGGARGRLPGVAEPAAHRATPGVGDEQRGGPGVARAGPGRPGGAATVQRGRREGGEPARRAATEQQPPASEPGATTVADPAGAAATARRPAAPAAGNRRAVEATRTTQRGTGTEPRALASTADLDALELGLRSQGEPVRERGVGERLDVVGGDEVAAVQPGPRARRCQQRGRAARAHAEGQRRRLPGRPGDVDDVAGHLGRRPAPWPHGRRAGARGRRGRRPRGGRRRRGRAGRTRRVPADDRELVARGGRGRIDLEQEPVELGLGQRVGALVLDRVLGRGDEERLRQRAGDPSTETWRSSIASSSAAWVLGGVRLISSASSRFVKTGPSRKANSRARCRRPASR